MSKTNLVEIAVRENGLKPWWWLLRKGVGIGVKCGVPVFRMLSDVFGVSEEVLNARVGAVFMNYQPVDDLEEAFVADDDTVALTGALPGLVGISMGKSSPLAGFRSGITFRSGRQVNQAQGRIKLKLFAETARIIGPAVLAYGIFPDPEDRSRVLGQIVGETDFLSLTINGNKTDQVKLTGLADDEFLFRVTEQ